MTSTDQLVYRPEEILADHDFAEPLIVEGLRCHGGLLSDGTYVSPRTRWRSPAIAAWHDAQERRSGSRVIEAPISEWPEAYPNVAQTEYLLSEGVRDPVIASLTRIGTVEGFGAYLPYVIVPDIQRFFVEDIEGTATAHLDRGLIEAHAADEAGDGTVAGHKEMWFLVRDIAFEHPVTEDQSQEMLARLGIGDSAGKGSGFFPSDRVVPEIDASLEFLLARMISLLFIEVAAYHTFAWAEAVLGRTDLVAGDGEPARLVSFIRTDEAPHVGYLRVVLSEMRSITFRTTDGATIAGDEVVGRLLAHAKTSIHDRREDGYSFMLAEVERAVAGRRSPRDVMARYHELGSVRPDADGRWQTAVALSDY